MKNHHSSTTINVNPISKFLFKSNTLNTVCTHRTIVSRIVYRILLIIRLLYLFLLINSLHSLSFSLSSVSQSSRVSNFVILRFIKILFSMFVFLAEWKERKNENEKKRKTIEEKVAGQPNTECRMWKMKQNENNKQRLCNSWERATMIYPYWFDYRPGIIVTIINK